MKAIHGLESQGYTVSLDGDKIRVQRKEGFNPEARMVKVLLREVQANREEAVRYLKQCGMSVWCDYQGVPRWISWPACEWHREEADPACSGCDPFSKKMKPIDSNVISFKNDRPGG